MTVGAGYYLIGVFATVLMLIVLALLNVIEKRFLRTSIARYISIEVNFRKGVVKTIRHIVEEFADSISNFTIQKHVKDERLRIQVVAVIDRDQQLEDLIETLSDVDGVRSLRVD